MGRETGRIGFLEGALYGALLLVVFLLGKRIGGRKVAKGAIEEREYHAALRSRYPDEETPDA